MHPAEGSVFTFGIAAVSKKAGLSMAKTTPGAMIQFQQRLLKKLDASSTIL